ERGRVSALKERIETDYHTATGGTNLHVFFDTQVIKGMDDWRNRILGALKETRLLMVFLSPTYLTRNYCAWEFHEYLNHESARALLGEGVEPSYFVEITDWTARVEAGDPATWVAELRRRDYFDLRPWFQNGVEALQDSAVQAQMEELTSQLRDRLERIHRGVHAQG